MKPRRAWRTILGAAALALLPALAGAQEKIVFPSLDRGADGVAVPLDGYIYRPPGDGPFPAIVGLHGCGGIAHRDGSLSSREAAWSKLFAARGYVVFLVDSFGPRDMWSRCPTGSPTVEPNKRRPLDAYGALLYLQGLPFVRADRVGLIGWSHGGATLLFTVDAASPARPRLLPKGDFRAAVAFYPGWCRGEEHPSDWHSDIPLLVLLGASDNWVLATPCIAFLERAKPRGAAIEIKVYPNTYHDFDWPNIPQHEVIGEMAHGGHPIVATNPAAWADARDRVPEFFDRHLKQ